MKRLVFITLLIGGVSSLSSQTITKSDSLEIVSKVADWNTAWKTKDAKLAAKWYSKDADFTNAFGFSMIGRDSIEEYLSRVFKMDFVMAGDSEQTSLKLRYVSDNSVMVITTILRKGQKLSDGDELGDRRTTHHRLFQKSNEWRIVAHLISDARSINRKEH